MDVLKGRLALVFAFIGMCADRLTNRHPRVMSATRRDILTAAQALFEVYGIRGATIDDIAARAGVTKRTVYYHFRSKDDLIAESLLSSDQDAGVLDFIFAKPGLSAQQVILEIFDSIEQRVADSNWRGCAFIRGAVELVGLPGHPGVVAARAYCNKLESQIYACLIAEGCWGAKRRARQVLIILEGAILHGMIHHDPAYIKDAAELAISVSVGGDSTRFDG